MGTKERIAREALKLFVEKGITETTIRDITSTVGITEGALYRHFASKEDLAWQLFSTNFVGFAREMEALCAGRDTLRSRLDAMIRAFCTFFDRDPILFSFLLLAQHSEARKVTPDMPHPVDIMRASLIEGMKRGEITAQDPDLGTAIVLGIVFETAIFKAYGRIDQDMTSLADDLIGACWRALRA